MKKVEDLIKEMENLGFQEEQIKEVLDLADQEIIDLIVEEFSLNAEEKIVQEYGQKFLQAQNNPSEVKRLLDEVIALQYGQENVEKKKEEMLAEYLQNIVHLTKQTRDLYQKYSQGDPKARQMVEDFKKTQTITSQTPQDNG